MRSKPGSSSSLKTDKETLNIHSGEKLDLILHLEEGSSLKIVIEQEKRGGTKSRSLTVSNPVYQTRKSRITHTCVRTINFFKTHWQIALIVFTLAIYLATRFIALDSFPIYFFTDEAIQTNRAADLVQNHWKGEGEEFLPTYFINGGQYNLGTSVYVQLLPYLIFGKSIWVTRGVSVLLSLLAVLAVGLMMRNLFKSSQPFLAVLILSTTPAWFLHSRTGFETVLAVSFYAAFLYCYLMYRNGKIGYVYAAAVFAALSFYSYSPAQMVITITVLGMFFIDIRYHWKNRKHLLPLLGIAVLCLYPYIRFIINHPDENKRHLEILHSYWIQSIPLGIKLKTYFSHYLSMLNPVYWFSPQTNEIIRHVMKGYGFLLWWTFPFVILGLVLTLLRLKKPEYRILLLSVLAAPSGAALVAASITRALFMVIPATILSAIALDQIINWLANWRVKKTVSILILFITLAGINGFMLYDSLVNGPTWYQEYDLYGMQYGARQVFGEIKEYLKENPHDKLFLASGWANGTDNIARFFFNDPIPFSIGGIEPWLNSKLELDDHTVFVVTPEEWNQVKENPKFKYVRVLRTINYPNRSVGFYFIKVAYADNIDQQFADEVAARHQLIDGIVTLQDGTRVTIKYSKLDMGIIQDAFDGNNETLIRTAEANPLIIKLIFSTPHPLRSVTIRVGGVPTTYELQILADGEPIPIDLVQKVSESNDYQDLTFTLDHMVSATKITLSIKNTDSKEPDHVHLWDVSLK